MALLTDFSLGIGTTSACFQDGGSLCSTKLLLKTEDTRGARICAYSLISQFGTVTLRSPRCDAERTNSQISSLSPYVQAVSLYPPLTWFGLLELTDFRCKVAATDEFTLTVDHVTVLTIEWRVTGDKGFLAEFD